MFKGIFSQTQSCLGVDIGKTSIKIAEIKRIKGQPTLVNYGYSEEAVDFSSNKNLQIDIGKSARLIKEICARAGIKNNNAVAALPSFSVFSSLLNLPATNTKNLADAVMWEAKKVMPLDLEEMILDWKALEENGTETVEKDGTIKTGDDKTGNPAVNGNVKILLTGAPKTLVKKYVAIFKEAKMNLLSLETEIFSLTRSLIGADKSVVALIDLGAVNTDIAIIANGLPMFGRSLDSGGIMLTKAVSDGLKVDFKRAEQFKLDLGSSSSGAGVLPEAIINAISPIVNEIKYSLNLFQQENNKQIEKLILSGGGANLPGIDNYLSGALNKKVIIGDPWARLSYPLDLKPALDEMGAKMAIAVGLALRETT
ncbi:MAG: type IV pilus assembly protein PilM [Methanoregula sp.]|jgi:type IV pilus assembly protein PilM|nr:type IV pilus assembly protein PilM [Methanoregula sp.]